MPVTRTLHAQALASKCVCGNEKLMAGMVAGNTPRPFCYACVQELLTRRMRGIYSAAYHETLELAANPGPACFMLAYDLCCDAIAAIRRGAWPTHLKRKKSLEDA
jgi:hypothetical protein